jgi:heme exporter protein D
MSSYAGLIEVVLSFIGVTIFVVWQMKSLKKDVAAREAREAEEAKAASRNPDHPA